MFFGSLDFQFSCSVVSVSLPPHDTVQPLFPLKHCDTMLWLLCSGRGVLGQPQDTTTTAQSGKHGPVKGTLCRGLPSFSIFQISCKSRFSGMGLLFQVLWSIFKSKLTFFSESAFPASRQHVSQIQTWQCLCGVSPEWNVDRVTEEWESYPASTVGLGPSLSSFSLSLCLWMTRMPALQFSPSPITGHSDRSMPQ